MKVVEKECHVPARTYIDKKYVASDGKEFIFESDTFKRAVSNFADNEASKEYMYRMIKNKRICEKRKNTCHFLAGVFV